MTVIAKSEYTYRDLCDFARRFNQIELLTRIAQAAVALPVEGADNPAYRRTPPWALAALAKASIMHGNPYRTRSASPKDVTIGCAIYNNINITTHRPNDPALNLLVRMAYEQFPWRQLSQEDLARVESLFDGYSGRKQLGVLDEAAVSELLGAPVKVAVRVAIMLIGIAKYTGGFFDLALLDRDDFTKILKVLPREQIESVINTSLVTDFADFKKRAAGAPPLANLEQYMFNPLTARPLLRLDDGRLLAPVPQLIASRLSPIELYYEGLKRWGTPFTRDMGDLLEDYVGRQLRSLPDVTVHAEIVYGGKTGKEKKSVDWIVVFDDLVLLVEVKSTRLKAGARAGAAETQKAVATTLSEAFEQIDCTHQLILDGVEQFSHLPIDRPYLGLVATLDPWYITNSTFARDFLHQPQIPSLIGSVGNLEALVAVGQRRSASEILQLITGDTEMSTWDLDASLSGFCEPTDSNPILEAIRKTYRFSPASDGSPADTR